MNHFTAYDLNKGTIKWQIGQGDDSRAAAKGAKGTAAAEFMKSSVIVTISGSPSMYEFDGRPYLLLTASPVGTRIGGEGRADDPAQTGPNGLVAFALKK